MTHFAANPRALHGTSTARKDPSESRLQSRSPKPWKRTHASGTLTFSELRVRNDAALTRRRTCSRQACSTAWTFWCAGHATSSPRAPRRFRNLLPEYRWSEVHVLRCARASDDAVGGRNALEAVIHLFNNMMRSDPAFDPRLAFRVITEGEQRRTLFLILPSRFLHSLSR